MKSTLTLLLLTALSLTACSDSAKKLKETDSARYYTEFFDRDGWGFTGGDATYSIPLPDGRTLWIFGDSFMGTVEEDGTRIRQDPMYIRNAIVVEDGDSTYTLFNGDQLSPKTLITPQEVLDNPAVTEDSLWYWPGDGYIERDEVILFLSKFRQSEPGMWGFEWRNTAIAFLDVKSLNVKEVIDLSESVHKGVHFGHAVYEDEQMVYLYGLKEGIPYGARYPRGEVRATWEYYSVQGWKEQPAELKPILDRKISEQFTVFKYRGRYLLVTQETGLMDDILLFSAAEPFGWSINTEKHIHTINKPFAEDRIFTYNTILHPQIGDTSKMFVLSYNTNTHRLADHFENAEIYRPRFISLPVQLFK